MAVLLAEFIIVAAIIIVCGVRLSKYGDVIAVKTGFGGAWTGLVLMAGITSLPELMTGASAVVFAGLPDIAVGDITGSCVFNLMILAMADLTDRTKPLFSKVSQSHVIASIFGAALIGIAAASILAGGSVPSIWHIGAYTPVILVFYAAGVRTVYYCEKKAALASIEPAREYDGVTLKKAVAMYSLNALAVVAIATALPFVAGNIAVAAGLTDSFVGTAFVAVTTSLPELVVSFAAMRIGAHNLAVGNILGSNMFNIALLGLDDILYAKGPLLSDVSKVHATTGFMAIIMTAIAAMSIAFRRKKKTSRIGWDSMVILATGFLSMYLSYSAG